MAFALAALLGKPGNIVAGKVEQTLVTAGLFVGVYIFALRVLDDLDFKGGVVVQLHDSGLNFGESGEKGSAIASSASKNFIAFTLRSYGDGLNEAAMLDAFAILCRSPFCAQRQQTPVLNLVMPSLKGT